MSINYKRFLPSFLFPIWLSPPPTSSSSPSNSTPQRLRSLVLSKKPPLISFPSSINQIQNKSNLNLKSIQFNNNNKQSKKDQKKFKKEKKKEVVQPQANSQEESALKMDLKFNETRLEYSKIYTVSATNLDEELIELKYTNCEVTGHGSFGVVIKAG